MLERLDVQFPRVAAALRRAESNWATSLAALIGGARLRGLEQLLITKIPDGEKSDVLTGATHEQALIAIRRTMSGETEPLLAPSETWVHELPLAA